ncbi:MAG: NifB/NifX family molybdenum-iron cluster-binding protein [Anaerolineales bacterium]|nr:NifB/NifX family molybdenum-iron cluster-binding protein [Anaerolineales bacterium]
MKIIISAAAESIDAEVDQRFGRSANLILVDTESLDWESFRNPGMAASGGAGVKAAQFVAGLDPDAVISGDFGPNAYEALLAADISMYIFNERVNTIRSVVKEFKKGDLIAVSSPTSAGKHGS